MSREKIQTLYKRFSERKGELTNLSYFLAFYSILCLLNILETGYFGFNITAKTSLEKFIDIVLELMQLVILARFIWKENKIIIVMIGFFTSELIGRISYDILMLFCK